MTDVLDEVRSVAGPWNLSNGGTALVLDTAFPVGVRVLIELQHPECDAPLVVAGRVEHTLFCPSFKELWLTGCSFINPIDEEELDPFAAQPNRR